MTARKAPPLRVVPAGRAAPAGPSAIADSLSGSSRDVLVAMRRALAEKLDAGELASNAIASAYKELRELDRLIRQIDAEESAASDPWVGIPDEPFDPYNGDF